MSRQNDMQARYAELKLNEDQINEVEEAFAKADKAQKEFETWSQEAIDRAIQSVAQIVANSKQFHELVEMGIGKARLAIRSAVKPSASRFAASCVIACARSPSASSRKSRKSASSSMLSRLVLSAA